AAPLTPAWQTLFPTLQQPWQESRASQTLSFHPERLACEPLGRGRCWRWAQPTASTFLSL
ncbi:MAG TPA: hypothetical protein VFB60_17570, partial [Ktedonobacteraceae bacterium]|nr:hypothetical protein [Ktedonobacteraceae bacterium]